MADLNEKDSSLSTKIVGSSAGGIESNYLGIGTDGSAQTIDQTSGLTSGSGAALNAFPIAAIDLKNYANLYVQITGTFVATVTFQGSIDGVNYVSVNAQTVSDTTTTPTQTTTSTGIFRVPILFRYFQLKITSYTSGTVTASALYTNDPANDLGKMVADANLNSGQLVPTITNKLRFRYDIADVTLPGTGVYQTIYTRSGTGLFFGFQVESDNSKINVRLTIDGGQVFDLPLDDIKTFQFNDTTDGRIQMGGFLTAIGNVLDFSSRFAIPYTTSVLVEMASNDATNHKKKRYIVIQTEDT